MINAILIDDEINALKALEFELKIYCPGVQILAKCQSGQEGLDAIHAFKPDLVFLDIEMPWMDGFEMLHKLTEINFDVIFVTAHDKFAIRAFEYSAVDYLLKPVAKEKLIQAVDKSINRNQRHIPKEHFEFLIQNLNPSHNVLPCIALPTTEGLEFVQIKDIIYAESDSNYCQVFLTGGSKIFLSKTLKFLEEALRGHPFLRIHQSYLINLTHTRKYVKGKGGYVVMNNGKSLTVSRAKRVRLMELFRKSE